MPPTIAQLSNIDIITAFDRALGNGKGVRIFCETRGNAVNKRQQCYRAREVDRQENKKIYPPDDPMYKRSIYDALIFIPRIAEDGSWFLYIEVSTPERLESVMEDL